MHAGEGRVTVAKASPAEPSVNFIAASIVLPIHLVSEANRASSEHWRERQRRAADQRGLTRIALAGVVSELRKAIAAGWKGPLAVTMTRRAPRALDSDNVVSACKHVRDGIADALGVSDRVPWIDWRCRQEKQGNYTVEIIVEAAA